MARCPLCKSSIEYLEPRVSTHCLAKFLEKRLSNGSPQARDAHVLECVERLDAVANGNDDGLKCAICAKSLAHLNAQRRAQHADRCGTKLDKGKCQIESNFSFYLSTSNTIDFVSKLMAAMSLAPYFSAWCATRI
jgi:hypothetical protein